MNLHFVEIDIFKNICFPLKLLIFLWCYNFDTFVFVQEQ